MLVLFLFFLEIQDGLSVCSCNPDAWRLTLGGGKGRARRNIQIFHKISVENRRGNRAVLITTAIALCGWPSIDW